MKSLDATVGVANHKNISYISTVIHCGMMPDNVSVDQDQFLLCGGDRGILC